MLKSVEVYCPNYAPSPPRYTSTSPLDRRRSTRLRRSNSRDSIATSVSSQAGEEDPGEMFLDELICSCLSVCQGAGPQPKQQQQQVNSNGRHNTTGLEAAAAAAQTVLGTHVLRAELRNGRKFVFLVEGDEGWKVGVGLQRMRKAAALALAAGEMGGVGGRMAWIAKALEGEEARGLIKELTRGEVGRP
ncbi:hypothetical protein DFH27DRAFT_569124 [Peziza echinospora]|nr:hypothetical protein DFH27DRAFT_569124 [Peziza echinospora]